MMKRALLLSAVVAVLVVGCSRDVSTPRPEAFPRMEIYDSAYVDVDAAIPLSVNASATAEVLKNGEWIDVVYPRYGGEMSVSIVFPLEFAILFSSILNSSAIISYFSFFPQGRPVLLSFSENRQDTYGHIQLVFIKTYLL